MQMNIEKFNSICWIKNTFLFYWDCFQNVHKKSLIQCFAWALEQNFYCRPQNEQICCWKCYKFLADTFAVVLPCGVWLSLNNLFIKQTGRVDVISVLYYLPHYTYIMAVHVWLHTILNSAWLKCQKRYSLCIL